MLIEALTRRMLGISGMIASQSRPAWRQRKVVTDSNVGTNAVAFYRDLPCHGPGAERVNERFE
jgi:hypothetical protein